MQPRNYHDIDYTSECTTTDGRSGEEQVVVCPRCSASNNFYLCKIMDRQKIWHELHCFACKVQGNRSGDFIKILTDEEVNTYIAYLKKKQP